MFPWNPFAGSSNRSRPTRLGLLFLSLWLLGQVGILGHHFAHQTRTSAGISAQAAGHGEAGSGHAAKDCEFCRLLSQVSPDLAPHTGVAVVLSSCRAPFQAVRLEARPAPTWVPCQGRAPPHAVA